MLARFSFAALPMPHPWRRLAGAASFLLACLAAPSAAALDHSQLAVVINTRDPLSVRIGETYAKRRRLSFQNIVRVEFTPGASTMGEAEFAAVKAAVDAQTRPGVQAYALTWAAPYRVECMSITAAFALGFDRAYCADGCKPTQAVPYFASASRAPRRDFGIRPTMSLAAATYEEAEALIERGIAADATHPAGTAYLLSTSDVHRNVRHLLFPLAERVAAGRLRVAELKQDSLAGAQDVMFYLTGRVQVDALATLRFLPGAVADHLTSAGGMLTDSPQMSALRWLEAGATGSYGTVVEPCNLLQKFPHPAVLMDRYLRGETLIEAYWKSVQMPGQGIFIGEPLATPWRQGSRGHAAH